MMRYVALFTASVVLVGCGGGGGRSISPEGDRAGTVASSSAPTTAPATDAPQRSSLETAALAAELVEVSAYRYVDLSDAERVAEESALPGSVSAASFHDVEHLTTGALVGRLVLLVVPPDSAGLAPGNAEGLAEQVLGTSAITRCEYSGHEVWVAEDLSQVARRVQYLWTRHGTLGGLGGPDRAAADAFLTAYFVVPYPGAEDPILAVRVVAVPGFGYSDATDRTIEVDAVAAVLPGATGSLHYVFDTTHMFAGLVLAGPVPPASAASAVELTNLLRDWVAEAYGPEAAAALEDLGTTTMGGTEVLHLRCSTEGVHFYVWSWPSTQVVGWLMTTRPDLARAFVPAFQALQSAEG